MPLRENIRFLKRYLGDRQTVGAVAPSSRPLARALCEPYRCFTKPACVLEIGAGTGAVTRQIGSIIRYRARDVLDICEVDPKFVSILRNEVLVTPEFLPAGQEGRVSLLHMPAQEIPNENRYDFIISGLPLTAFQRADVEAVISMVRRALKPNGVFSYFEYVGLRKITRTFAMGENRIRLRDLSPLLDEHIRRYQFRAKRVFRNLPPATARHFRYNAAEANTPVQA